MVDILYIHTHPYISVKVKVATIVEGDSKLLHRDVGEVATPFP